MRVAGIPVAFAISSPYCAFLVSVGTVFQVPWARIDPWPAWPAELRAAADVVVRIPMAGGVDSLNVAAASAVAFWATRV